MDLRFKDHYLQDKEGTLLSVKGECLEVTPDVNSTQSDGSQSTTASPSANEDTSSRAEAPPAKRLKGLAAVLQCISNEEGAASTQPTLTPAEKINKEIQAYLDLPVASSDTDPLVCCGEWSMTVFLILLKSQESMCAIRECLACLAQLGTFVMTADADCYPRM